MAGDGYSPAKAKVSPAKSKDENASPAGKVESREGSQVADVGDHVSGPPVKQSMFGKLKSMSVTARDSFKNLKETYLPRKDDGDVEENEEGEERPKTGTKTKTSTDDDGPAWEPGTEQLMWTDPTYVVQKFVQPGIHPNHNKHFVKPEVWWNRCASPLACPFSLRQCERPPPAPSLTLSLCLAFCSAEDAIKMLVSERRGLKEKSLDQQNLLARTLLATNRLVATRLGGMVDGSAAAKGKGNQFRGGVEPIAHVLPPDVQRALHSKLCKAVKNGEKEVMSMLLRYDIDLDYADTFGTPLHYAAFFGQLQAAHTLLDRGAFPGALNYREQTPLHVACSKNAYTVADLLVRYGAPLNAMEMGGLTAMHIACTAGFMKVVDNLIMGGADCNKQNRIGWSPLHLACIGMHHKVIEKLCISGMADPNAGCGRTKNVMIGKGRGAYTFEAVKGDTAAHFAAKQGFFMCLKVLLENGADPCAANEHGETIMHLAAHIHDMRCVERILEYGWDFIDMEDKHGRDPIDVCDDVLGENTGEDPEPVRIRRITNDIKTLLQKTSVRKNQAAHKTLMEQAKRGVGGRKKRTAQDAPPVEAADQNRIEIEEKPMDDRTMEEKISAMKIELESARAEARAAEAQSRMKTYNLNETLLETKRRLAEVEFMLERERESRLALEQDVIGLIGVAEEEDNLKGGFAEEGGVSADSSRIGTAQGSYDYGSTYERMSLKSGYNESELGSRTLSALEDAPAPITRTPSGVMKNPGRSFSGTTQSVKFAETDDTLEDELNEYERMEASAREASAMEASAMSGAPPRQPIRGLAHSRGNRGGYSGHSAQSSMSVYEVSLLYVCILGQFPLCLHMRSVSSMSVYEASLHSLCLP